VVANQPAEQITTADPIKIDDVLHCLLGRSSLNGGRCPSENVVAYGRPGSVTELPSERHVSGSQPYTSSAAAQSDNRLGTGLGDRSGAPQGHSGRLKEHVEQGIKAI
jgi:hypothetical protein